MDARILDVVRDDPRYTYNAYEFVCDAVGFTQEILGKFASDDPTDEIDCHVSGPELVRGACELAINEFGMMAPVVFKMWGIQRTGDIGNIVFNLIDGRLLCQSDRDDLQDFQNLFDLEKELSDGFEFTLAEPEGPLVGDR